VLNEREQSFVNTFIVPQKRSRYLLFLASQKRRLAILDRLNHALDIWSLAKELAPEDSSADGLLRLLRRKGAEPICHIIADSSDLDGQEVPLEDAIEFALGWEFGTILCCSESLAYYKPETPPGEGASGYLLECST
jgi:hypothetical protein